LKARVLVASSVAVVASLVIAASASAAGETAQVTLTSDDGITSGCELRNAIDAVTNNASGNGCTVVDTNGLDDHITFAPALSGQTITLGGSELAVNDPEDLDLDGPGMNQLTISGNDLSRVFNVQTNTTITGMSLVHGLAPPTGGISQGGAIESTASGPFSLVLTDVKVANSAATATASSGTAFADGAAIHSVNGRLVLDQSVVTGNTATATGTSTGNAEARGGAIFSQDGIQITDSTISGNQATATTAGLATGAQATSGIRSDDQLEMFGSTVSGNTANADAPATGSSSTAHGALYLTNGTTSDVEQSTIAANKGDASGASPTETGGVDIANDVAIRSSTIALNGPDTATNVDGANILVENGSNQVSNTIISNPRGGGTNCVVSGGVFVSDGFNDDSSPANASCFTPQLSTDLNTDPLLAAAGLQPNGGLTQTIALQPTSPVIDQGTNSGLNDPNQDQRGASFPRPVDFSGLPNADNGTDIGAFEVQQACAGFTQPTPSTACPSTPTPPPPPTSTTTAPTKKKKCKKAKKGATSAKKKCKKRKK
jgi:hypothetical protein